MQWNRWNRMAAIVAVLGTVGAVACGGGGTEPNPDPGGKPKVDPFATFYVADLMTAASGKRAAQYDWAIVFGDTVVFQGGVSPRYQDERFWQSCSITAGFVGDRPIALVALTDTIAGAGTYPSVAKRDSAFVGTLTWPGLVRVASATFDPLVSADTSRGHSTARPVKWRWTLADAGATVAEDSTTTCNWF